MAAFPRDCGKNFGTRARRRGYSFKKIAYLSSWMMPVALLAVIFRAPLRAEQISLQTIVTPSTTILEDGRPVTFAVHGFIEFKSLAELFPYIESQTQRWKLSGGLDDAEQKNLARELLLCFGSAGSRFREVAISQVLDIAGVVFFNARPSDRKTAPAT